ncbi:MAG: UDP-N-acetylmuramoyl-L-alanyl-D-glutamate--2,6-diaminopimelate ligase [Flavobacteriales bacterium]|nr:UDP-N-acetylmuramoyl-L-alanyl-D-glutamate--2,6-diaminopimelate ligase [Flavobacteriales bacterium]
MKTINNIIKDLPVLQKINFIEEAEINSLEFDSRKINQNDVFFAIKGTEVDGHKFIPKAIELGAKVIVCEEIPQEINSEISYIKVESTTHALGIIARNYFDNPTSKFKLIGITGTNGKTSCTTLLYNLFKSLNYKVALISTVENRIDEEIIPTTHTTPDSITLNKLFNKAVEKKCEYVFMEVSSHGIHQNRLSGLSFDIAGFTNISHDHLDYHKTFQEYLYTKKRFFDELPKNAVAITNVDDKNGKIMLQNSKATKKEYSLTTIADYKGKVIDARMDGMMLNFNGTEFWIPMVGKFNAYNALLVYAIASELKLDSQQIILELSKIKTPKGRFETYISDTGIITVIDFAHTPDALKNVIETINKTRQKQNKNLITVFGCGGNRDKQKRPLMGKIATNLSDKVILTSDNPRDENPDEIIQEIIQGIQQENFGKYVVISNRKEAIKSAILSATKNDIILIAGKGHENYQEINGVKTHFDDLETTKELFELLKK